MTRRDEPDRLPLCYTAIELDPRLDPARTTITFDELARPTGPNLWMVAEINNVLWLSVTRMVPSDADPGELELALCPRRKLTDAETKRIRDWLEGQAS